MKNRAAHFQSAAQLEGIAQIAVMGQGQLALHMVHHNGLAVCPVGGTGGSVTHMAHGHGPARELLHHITGEHIPHLPQIPVGGENAVLIDDDAAALLAPVLQSIQPIVGQIRQVLRLWRPGTEDAALLMNLLHRILLWSKKRRLPGQSMALSG